MPRETFDVEVPEGTHLGVSRDTGGAYRAHLFADGTNELVGHAELFEPDGDAAEPSPVFVYIDDRQEAQSREATEAERLIGNLLLLGALMVAEKAKPHVERWWAEHARPALKAKWDSLADSRSRKADRRARPAEAPAAVETPAALAAEEPAEVADALDAYKFRMSSDEARARFVTAITARLVSDEQLEILRNARIEGHDGPLDLQSLTPDQIGQALTAMLEAKPSLLDADTAAAELGRLLGPATAQADRVPLTPRRRVPLRLPPANGK